MAKPKLTLMHLPNIFSCIIISIFLASCSVKPQININNVTQNNASPPLHLRDTLVNKNGNPVNLLINDNSYDALFRRKLTNKEGSFFGIIIDSSGDSYSEVKILVYSRDSISYLVTNSRLRSKRNFVQFKITYRREYLQYDISADKEAGNYQLTFTNNNREYLDSFPQSLIVGLQGFQNNIIQNNVLELMTGQFVTNDRLVKFIALNDVYDSNESIAGLFLISTADRALLEMKCNEMAAKQKCPPGMTAIHEIVTKNYLFAKDYTCGITCIKINR